MVARDVAGSLKHQRLIEALRRLLRREAEGSLHRLLVRTRAEDVAALLPTLATTERQALLQALLPEKARAAEVLAQLGPQLAAPLVTGLARDVAASVLDEMRADDSADLLAALPEEAAQEILRAMRPAEQQEVQELMQYRPTTAGGIMGTDFFALDQEKTAGEAIAALQQAADAEMVFYVYCVNESGKLTGVLSLRDLLRVPAATPLGRIMNPDVIAVRPDVHQEEVARTVERYDLLAVPVVDEFGKLVGIVTVDDVIDVLREEATEDILKMAGASASDEHPEGGAVLAAIRGRFPWVATSLVAGLVAAAILAGDRAQIERQVLLAAFVPVVLGAGGSVGTQAATVVMRSMATATTDEPRAARMVLREVRIGLPLALLGGVAAFAAGAAFPGGGLKLGLVVGASLAVVMVASAVLGALAPVAARRLDVDTAWSTGPAMSTVLHVVSIVLYLAVAAWVLGEV